MKSSQISINLISFLSVLCSLYACHHEQKQKDISNHPRSFEYKNLNTDLKDYACGGCDDNLASCAYIPILNKDNYIEFQLNGYGHSIKKMIDSGHIYIMGDTLMAIRILAWKFDSLLNMKSNKK